jgi:predicted nucleic acid-binding protein
VTAKVPARAIHVAEPPPACLGRPPLVVDCSVLVAVLFQEPMREEALRCMAGKSLHAPVLLDSEIANVAVKKTRGGVPQAVIADALEMYVQQAIELHRPDVPAQYALAIRFGLSAYDAAYLWLAGALQAPLVTFDAKLGAAARGYLAGS